MRSTLLLVLLVLASALHAEPASPPVLSDHYGNAYPFEPKANEAVLVIVVDARKLRWLGKWEKKLRASLPALSSYRVTGSLDDPKPDYDSVAKAIRRHVFEEIPIGIDLEDYWANRYSLDIAEPCLLLLNGDQEVVARWRGRPRQELVTEVLETLTPYFTPANSAATAP